MTGRTAKRRAALWILGLAGALVLALVVSVGCGDGDDEGTFKLGDLEISDASARAGVHPSALYFTVKNTGDTDDALIGVASDVAGMAELHRTVTEGVTARMEPVEQIDVPANGEATLEPGGYHVMLMELEEPLEVGDTIEATLTFEEAGSVSIQVPVTSYAEQDDAMGDGMDDATDGMDSGQ